MRRWDNPGDRAYLGARLRNRLYDHVMREYMASGIPVDELAKRIGRRPATVRNLLASPGRWTFDIVADLMLGIAHAELRFETAPLDSPGRAALDDATRSDEQA